LLKIIYDIVMYLTRQDLKVEVRDLHGQIREVISDFNGAIKNLPRRNRRIT